MNVGLQEQTLVTELSLVSSQAELGWAYEFHQGAGKNFFPVTWLEWADAGYKKSSWKIGNSLMQALAIEIIDQFIAILFLTMLQI